MYICEYTHIHIIANILRMDKAHNWIRIIKYSFEGELVMKTFFGTAKINIY